MTAQAWTVLATGFAAGVLVGLLLGALWLSRHYRKRGPQ